MFMFIFNTIMKVAKAVISFLTIILLVDKVSKIGKPRPAYY
jgi:hypothetical protein